MDYHTPEMPLNHESLAETETQNIKHVKVFLLIGNIQFLYYPMEDNTIKRICFTSKCVCSDVK